MRTISGPQGPRVVLDGRPVLLLCSDNYLGFADHAQVREAAADAALRFGAGAGAARGVSGTMSVHGRLERRLADFHGTDTALLFGSGYLAGLGAIRALAESGRVVCADALSPDWVADGCRLAGAELFVHEHGDVDHLAWGLRQHSERAGLIVTAGVFAADGDLAPLEDVVALAHRHAVSVLVDESHAVGTIGPGGRGACALASLAAEVDAVVGSLAKALGSQGAYVACDGALAQCMEDSPGFGSATAPAPPAVAAADAALELLRDQPQVVDKLATNADTLRAELHREGFDTLGSSTQIVSIVVGDADDAAAMAHAALEQGVFIRADDTRLRLTVMASHTRGELREAARVLGRAALHCGLRPATMVPAAEVYAGAEVVPLVPRAA